MSTDELKIELTVTTALTIRTLTLYLKG